MAKSQATINEKTLDNGTWRRMYGQVGFTDSNGVILIEVPFTISANGGDVEDVQQRWNSTRDDFTLLNHGITFTMDTAATGDGQYLHDFTPGDDYISTCASDIVMDTASENTTGTLHCILRWTGVKYKAASLSGPGGGAVVVTDGLIETPKITQIINAGRVESRVAFLKFAATDDTDGKENYESARSTILIDILGTDADGTRNSDTGLALTEETLEYSGTGSADIDVLLRAEYMEVDINGVQSLNLSIEAAPSPAWSQDENAGPVPTLITVRGSATVNTSIERSFGQHWANIKAAVESQVQERARLLEGEGGGGGSINPISGPIVNTVRKSGEITFSAVYQSENAEVLTFSVGTQIISQKPRVRVMTADGYHRKQESPGPEEARAYVTVTRIGLFSISLSAEDFKPQAPAGFEFELDDASVGRNGPQTRPFGTCYEQTWRWTFTRVRYANSSFAGSGGEDPLFGQESFEGGE